MATSKTKTATAKKPAAGKTTIKTATAKKPAAKTSAKSTAKAPAAKKPAAKAAAPKAAAAKKPAAARAKKAPAASVPSPEQRYRMIEVAAYFLAEKNAFAGSSLDYWVAAEAQIDGMLGSK